jgi:hypothetical protein
LWGAGIIARHGCGNSLLPRWLLSMQCGDPSEDYENGELHTD